MNSLIRVAFGIDRLPRKEEIYFILTAVLGFVCVLMDQQADEAGNSSTANTTG